MNKIIDIAWQILLPISRLATFALLGISIQENNWDKASTLVLIQILAEIMCLEYRSQNKK